MGRWEGVGLLLNVQPPSLLHRPKTATACLHCFELGFKPRESDSKKRAQKLIQIGLIKSSSASSLNWRVSDFDLNRFPSDASGPNKLQTAI